MNTNRTTGPTPPAGRAISRFDALKQGVDARSLVFPGQDPDFTTRSREFHDEFRPVGPVECVLVSTLVESRILSLGFTRLETEYLNQAIDELGDQPFPLGAVYGDRTHSKVLDRIARHQEQADRAWFRTLQKLLRIQQERRKRAAAAVLPVGAEAPVRSAGPQLVARNPSAAAPEPSRRRFAPSGDLRVVSRRLCE